MVKLLLLANPDLDVGHGDGKVRFNGLLHMQCTDGADCVREVRRLS